MATLNLRRSEVMDYPVMGPLPVGYVSPWRMNVGDRFILITSDSFNGPFSYHFSATIPETNMSFEPRVEGWLGETCGTNRRAYGWWVITEINEAEDSVVIERLNPDTAGQSS